MGARSDEIAFRFEVDVWLPDWDGLTGNPTVVKAAEQVADALAAAGINGHVRAVEGPTLGHRIVVEPDA